MLLPVSPNAQQVDHYYQEIAQPRHEAMSLDTCIAAWLHAKQGRSKSERTHATYQDTLQEFRDLLVARGRDLDSEPSMIAPLAQGWARSSKVAGRDVTPNTNNQRLAILSSFYAYAIRHEVLAYNPIERVERQVVAKTHQARPIAATKVKTGLAAIDRTTTEGKRDYALLAIALKTGRRAIELANMRYGDITWNGATCIIFWPRCKGNKQMQDTLPVKTTAALLTYLQAEYGPRLAQLPHDAPVWVSHSHHNEGEAVGYKTVSRICEQHLGTSKVHATRHTHAVEKHKQGATLAEIGRGLGHSNLKTTSDYLEELLADDDKYGESLEEAFGI